MSPSSTGDPHSPAPDPLPPTAPPRFKLSLKDFAPGKDKRREGEVAKVLGSPVSSASPGLNRMVSRKGNGNKEWRSVMRMIMRE